jgi:hypothetical protein
MTLQNLYYLANLIFTVIVGITVVSFLLDRMKSNKKLRRRRRRNKLKDLESQFEFINERLNKIIEDLNSKEENNNETNL